MTEIITISIPPEARKLVDELRKIKPQGTSFSKTIRLMLEEHIRTQTNPLALPKADTLNMSSNIDEWKKLITEMEVEDFKKLQRKHSQINSLINKRVTKCLK